MSRSRIWKIVAASALMIISVQVLSRSSANLLSIRSSRSEMLDDIWPRSSTLLHYPSWSGGQVEPDTSWADAAEKCGATADLGSIAERLSESTVALREMAQSMYRADIIEAIADAVPWWRVKLWQFGYGLGLWSDRLDQPSKFLSAASIEKARRSADGWYQRVSGQLVCDALWSADAKAERK